jgi:hypothetical protein
MDNRLLMLILAIVGTVIGWDIVSWCIIDMTFWQFVGVELIISLMHGLYNRAKRDLIQKS